MATNPQNVELDSARSASGGTIEAPIDAATQNKDREIVSAPYAQALADIHELARSTSEKSEEMVNKAFARLEQARAHNQVISAAPSRDWEPELEEQITRHEDPRELDKQVDRVVMQAEAKSDMVRTLQELGTEAYLRVVCERANARQKGNDFTRKDALALPSVKRLNRAIQRANIWAPGVAGAGLEIVPIGVASILTDIHRVPVKAVGVLSQFTIPDGVGEIRLPAHTSGGASQVTIDSWTDSATIPPIEGASAASNPGTGYVLLKPVVHRRTLATRLEEVQDASVAVLQALIKAAEADLVEAWEGAVYNAQTLNSGIDTTFQASMGVGYANGYTIAGSNGMRNQAFVSGATFNGAGASFGLSHFESMRSAMSDLGMIPEELAFSGRSVHILNMIKDPVVRAMNTGGPIGTIAKGAVTEVYGIDIFNTKQLPGTGAGGFIITGGAGANTFTTCAMYNKLRWFVGTKRNIEIKILDLVGSYGVALYGFARHAVGYVPPATDKICSVGYNFLAT